MSRCADQGLSCCRTHVTSIQGTYMLSVQRVLPGLQRSRCHTSSIYSCTVLWGHMIVLVHFPILITCRLHCMQWQSTKNVVCAIDSEIWLEDTLMQTFTLVKSRVICNLLLSCHRCQQQLSPLAADKQI